MLLLSSKEARSSLLDTIRPGPSSKRDLTVRPFSLPSPSLLLLVPDSFSPSSSLRLDARRDVCYLPSSLFVLFQQAILVRSRNVVQVRSSSQPSHPWSLLPHHIPRQHKLLQPFDRGSSTLDEGSTTFLLVVVLVVVEQQPAAAARVPPQPNEDHDQQPAGSTGSIFVGWRATVLGFTRHRFNQKSNITKITFTRCSSSRTTTSDRRRPLGGRAQPGRRARPAEGPRPQRQPQQHRQVDWSWTLRWRCC